MKSSWFVAGIIVLMVSICGGVALAIGNQFAIPGNITATVSSPAALMAEATATVEPTATPDGTIPTQQALLDKVATAQAENNKLQEQIRQINLEAQALETRNKEAEAAIAKAQADKARADADKAAQDAIIADAKTRAIAETNQGVVMDTQRIVAQAELEKTKNAKVMQLIIGGAIIVMAILGTVAMFRNRPQEEPEPVTEAGYSDDKQKSEPMVAHLHTDAGTVKRIINPPATEAVFRNWAECVTTGDSAAIDMWETAESPFKGRQYRDYFYPWLVKNNMLTTGTDNRRVLSNIGLDYCREWLARHTPSPIVLTDPKTAPTATVSTENGHGNAEGEAPKGEKEG